MKSNQFVKKHTDIRIIKEEKKKKKFNWDKIIYLSILFISLGLFFSYVFKKYYYVTGDGKVLFETLDIQLVHDVQIKKITCKIGDSISVGDTLFYYVHEQAKDNKSSASVHNNVESDNWKDKEKLKIEDLISLRQIEKTKNYELLKEIKKDKDRVQKEVYLDVYTADRLDPYIRQINDYTYRIKSLEEEIELMKRTLKKIDEVEDLNSPLNVSIRVTQDSIDYMKSLENVFISPVNGIISHIFKKNFETVPQSEHILSIHIPTDNVYIKVFFEQEDVKHLHVDDEVEVEFSNGYHTKGKISRFYFDTYELPIYLKSGTEDFHRDIEADIVPVRESEIPLWKKCQKLEVKVIKQRYF